MRGRPVERSSGARRYRRLNRGGDRRANAALHRIMQARLRFDPQPEVLRAPYPAGRDPARNRPMPRTLCCS
ncbi:transposase [Streptomyces sp. NPDC020472]|uniref:transposase n=1 Tax=Streptomyces sp. NPDC020472 TaxID=3365075 RepID=UPI0037B8AECF